MKIDFSKNKWTTGELVYANSYRYTDEPEFSQLDDCIVNRVNPKTETGFDNISLMTKEKFSGKTLIRTRCSFDKYGAPLIVVAQEMDEQEGKIPRYGNYFEVVIYENGINIWRMWCENKKVSWKKMMSVTFDVSAKEIHSLTVVVNEEGFEVDADGRKMTLYVPDMYSSYHVGIDACEDINRFYDFEVESVKETGKKFRCTVCNHLHIGDNPPKTCPDCNGAPEKYVVEE